jgi:hypothetical protein
MIFTNNKFQGFYPVGNAAIVQADNKIEAAQLLQIELKEFGLDQIVDPDHMECLPPTKKVLILCDGNY